MIDGIYPVSKDTPPIPLWWTAGKISYQSNSQSYETSVCAQLFLPYGIARNNVVRCDALGYFSHAVYGQVVHRYLPSYYVAPW